MSSDRCPKSKQSYPVKETSNLPAPSHADGPPARIPTPTALPPINAFIGLGWGLLLVLTLIIPWGFHGGEPSWAWRFFNPRHDAGFRAMLVGGWVIGLVSILASLLCRQSWLPLVYLVAGSTGTALLFKATGPHLKPWIVFAPVVNGPSWAAAAGLAAIALFLITGGVGTRTGRQGLFSIVQAVSCEFLAVVVGLAAAEQEHFITQAGHSANLVEWISALLGVAVIGLCLAGSVLTFFHCAGFSASDDRRDRLGRRLVLAALFLMFTSGVIKPAIEGHRYSPILEVLNNQILMAGFAMLVLEGITGLTTALVLRPTRPRPQHLPLPKALSVLAPAAGLALGLFLGLAGPSTPVRGTVRAAVTEAPVAKRVGDWTQWCGGSDRNMVSDEKGLPDHFESISNEKRSELANVKWIAPLDDTSTLGSPVVAGGKVLIGGHARGVYDYGVLWCFRESDGKLLWRMLSPYIASLYNYTSFGVCATPTVEGDRVYLLNHLGDVLCLNGNGLASGNLGPFKDEAAYFATGQRKMSFEIAPDGKRLLDCTPGDPVTLGPLDADILWRFDLLREVNCWPCNALNAGIIVRGDNLYVATCSTQSDFGEEGSKIRVEPWKQKYKQTRYESPALIVLNKHTGKLLARTIEDIFDLTFHGAHSSPTWGTVNGRELLIYGGGNGTCYAFDPNFTPGPGGQPGELKLVWKFNCLAPETYGAGAGMERLKKAETIATPVFYKQRVYTSVGNDLMNSGAKAGPGRLLCLDASGTGDITRTGMIWSFDEMRSTSSTVAIADGLLYTGDASGTIYCLDAETGRPYWTHSGPPVWSSPLIADGKVYLGLHNGGLLIFAHSKEKKLLSQNMGRADIVSCPAVANGVVYVASQKHLYALQQGRTGGLAEPARPASGSESTAIPNESKPILATLVDAPSHDAKASRSNRGEEGN